MKETIQFHGLNYLFRRRCPELSPLSYSVYLKIVSTIRRRPVNRTTECSVINPDFYHIRVSNALVYFHVPKGPKSPRYKDNANIGFVLGINNDYFGYKIYNPQDNTRIWASDV